MLLNYNDQELHCSFYEQFTDIAELKKQNGRLQSVIDNIRNEQIALQTQVERLQQKLSEQYDKYRSEVRTEPYSSVLYNADHWLSNGSSSSQ